MRGTVPSVVWRAVLLLAAVIWVAPSCVHPAIGHSTPSTRCAHRQANTAPDQPPQEPVTSRAPRHGPADVSRSGTGNDNCVAGSRSVAQALVPTPVPPPLLAEVAPIDGPQNPDSVRAPPGHLVHALGLHQLQVLRT